MWGVVQALQREGLLPFNSCRIEIFLYRKPLLCSPLEPLIANFEELQHIYQQAEAATQLGKGLGFRVYGLWFRV